MKYQISPLTKARSTFRAFVNKFVDKTLPQYRAVMGHCDFYGGNTHNGLLWEVIRPYNLITESKAFDMLSSLGDVFVMWDRSISSNPRNLQKSRMIKLKSTDLVKELRTFNRLNRELTFLPRDIYVFDEDLTFYITFTHQYLKGFGRICLTSFENIQNETECLFQNLLS